MVFLLMLPVLYAVAAVHGCLQLYAPSNLLISWSRQTPPQWRHMLLPATFAAATLIAMHLLAEAITVGAPGWLNLIVLVLAWDAIKFGVAAVGEVFRVCFRGSTPEGRW